MGTKVIARISPKLCKKLLEQESRVQQARVVLEREKDVLDDLIEVVLEASGAPEGARIDPVRGVIAVKGEPEDRENHGPEEES